MEKIVPINEEVKLANKRYLVSETDAKGVITYCNDYFTEISGYSREELIGYTAHRKTISHSAVDVITPLYAKLVEIENEKDIQVVED